MTEVAEKPKRAKHAFAPIQPLYCDIEHAPHVVRLSQTTIDDLERRGEFPKRRLLSGRRVGYLMRELQEWAETRPASDLPPVPQRRAEG